MSTWYARSPVQVVMVKDVVEILNQECR